MNGDNETLIGNVVKASAPGLEGYSLTLPTIYAGPNYVYSVSIAPSGEASFATYNRELSPPSTHPMLPPPPLASAARTAQTPSHIQSGTAGIAGGLLKGPTGALSRHEGG